MNKDLIERLERPARVEELAPHATLRRMGISPEHVLCDLGAGTGIFSIPAAIETNKTVYALEASDQALEVLEQKRKALRLKHLVLIKVEDNQLPLEDESCDRVLLITVYHELTDRKAILVEMKRILKTTGMLAVVEFHGHQTPMGPSLEERVPGEVLERELWESGFQQVDSFSLGENFYCSMFQLKQTS